MKLNEKHLSLFASTSSIDKQGYLNKRGELNKAFQKRWFVLIGNLLFYYDKKGDLEPTGVIVLEGFSIEMVENLDKYAFELVFSGLGCRTYTLAAESQDEMEDWMRALTCASYDYMKMAIKDLQNQLDELIADEKKASINAQPPPGNQSRSKRPNPFESSNESNNRRSSWDLGKCPSDFEELHQFFGQLISMKIGPFNAEQDAQEAG